MFRALSIAAALLTATTASSEQLAVATWNVESYHFFSTCAEITSNGRCGERTAAGASPAVTAISLRDDFNGIDLFALTEVAGEEEAETFAIVADDDEGADYRYFIGNSGGDIRVAMVFSSERLELLESAELDFASTSGRSRDPLAARFRLRESGTEFWAVAVHLTRGSTRADGSGDGDVRNDAQARELRAWIEAQTLPVIALGDFNFDVNFATNSERIGYHSFTERDGPIWIRPDSDVDTSWSGSDRDRFPNSILDFVFISQSAADWQSVGYAYRREGDFPDTWRTADHRPVVAVFNTDPSAPFSPNVTDFLPAMLVMQAEAHSRNAGQPMPTTTAALPEVMEMLATTPAPPSNRLQSFAFPPNNASSEEFQILLEQMGQMNIVPPPPRLIEELN